MKILFLGYAVGYDLAERLSGISIAGNKMQVNLIKGLAAHEDVELKSFTVFPVAAFPSDKKAFIKAAKIQIAPGISSLCVPFINLPIIKQICQTLSVYLTARKQADKDTIIFTFNLFPQVGLPAIWLKRKYGCQICSLLADLPIDDVVGTKNILRNFFRKIFDNLTIMAIKGCDKLIVLNQQAVLDYAPGKPYIVVEGGVEEDTIQPLQQMQREKKNIVYSGALTEYSGILTLIEAMKDVEDTDVILEIYGGGYLAEEIMKLSKELPNVKYCGKVKNEEMLAIQRDAYLLVNPRPVNDAISRVTFPSKIFEYMISGTPVLTTRLNGLTSDFLSHLYAVENGTVAEFAEAINNTIKKPLHELQNMASEAHDFITKKKTWNKQCERILEFISGKHE